MGRSNFVHGEKSCGQVAIVNSEGLMNPNSSPLHPFCNLPGPLAMYLPSEMVLLKAAPTAAPPNFVSAMRDKLLITDQSPCGDKPALFGVLLKARSV